MSATEVTCPDCGKYIAPPGAIESTLRCRCAEEDAAANAPARPVEQVKRCYICSADLMQRKRLKDHLGRYWCEECAKADKRAKKRALENQCPDCHRLFAPGKLVEHGDERVCKSCYKRRIEETRQKLVKMGHAAASKRHEIKHIKWLLIVLIVLILLGTISFFRS